MIQTKWVKTKIDAKPLTAENWKEESKKLPHNVRVVALAKLLLEQSALLENQTAERKIAAMEHMKKYYGN